MVVPQISTSMNAHQPKKQLKQSRFNTAQTSFGIRVPSRATVNIIKGNESFAQKLERMFSCMKFFGGEKLSKDSFAKTFKGVKKMEVVLDGKNIIRTELIEHVGGSTINTIYSKSGKPIKMVFKKKLGKLGKKTVREFRYFSKKSQEIANATKIDSAEKYAIFVKKGRHNQ